MSLVIRETAFDPVFDSQRCFRQVLTAMARPGEIVTLPRVRLEAPWEAEHGALLVLLTLLDLEVTFAVMGPEASYRKPITRYLAENTQAVEAAVPAADFLLVLGPTRGDLAEARRGTPEAPDGGSTVIYIPDRLTANEGTRLTLQGPGIRGRRTLGIVGLLREELVSALSLRDFPLGIDLIFAATDRSLAAVPRSSSVELLG